MNDQAQTIVEDPARELTQQEVDARLAAAAGQPVYVKIGQIPPDAVPFLTQKMVRAQGGCRHCHGQGHVGHLSKDSYNPLLKRLVKAGAAIPCKCLMVNVTALKAAIAEAQAKADVDAIMAEGGIIEHPGPLLGEATTDNAVAFPAPAAETDGADHEPE